MRNTMPTGASVTITGISGHDAGICDLTPGHDHRNCRSRCRNVRSRWNGIPTRTNKPAMSELPLHSGMQSQRWTAGWTSETAVALSQGI